MKDALIFLGTGNATNLERQMTGMCFVVDNVPLLLDCGDGFGTLRQLRSVGVDPVSIRNILLTHHHADHINGMPHILFSILVAFPCADIAVYGPKKTLEVAKNISFLTHDYTRNHKQNISWKSMKEWQNYTIGPYVVTGAKVDGANGESPVCYAYALSAKGKKIVFTGDMKPNNAIVSLAKNADIVIHECFGESKDEIMIHSFGHSTSKDAGLLATSSHARQLILTHFPMEKGLEKRCQHEAEEYFNGHVDIAEDQMIISL